MISSEFKLTFELLFSIAKAVGAQKGVLENLQSEYEEHLKDPEG